MRFPHVIFGVSTFIHLSVWYYSHNDVRTRGTYESDEMTTTFINEVIKYLDLHPFLKIFLA